MSDYGVIFWLFVFTLLAALTIGAYQILSVRRSQLRRGEEPGEVVAAPPGGPAAERERYGR